MYFYANSKSKDGFYSQCKLCMNKANTEYKHAHPEKTYAIIKNYYESHKEQILSQEKEYYQKNKERHKKYECSSKEYKKKYLKAHKEHIAITRKEYDATHKENIGIYRQKRRTKRKQLPCTFNADEWKKAIEYFDNCCAYCGSKEKLTQDHFVALSKGGEYSINNIIPCCLRCNESKRDKDFFKWYPSQKFYKKSREKKILQYLNYDKTTKVQQLTFEGEYIHDQR